MKLYNVLSYDIMEHNRIWTIHQTLAWPSFWRSLGRRYHRLLRWDTLRTLWYFLWHPCYKLVEPLKPILFVTISKNNDRALSPMWDRLDKESYSIIDQRNHNQEIPVALVLFYSLLYIWPLLRCYFRVNKYEKSLMCEYFDEYFCTIGYMVVIEKLLKHSEVKIIVMANDHESFNRAFVRVANMLKIKTMYTQHCSVTEYFPPLEYSYSFLDGEESFIKYSAKVKPQGEVYLSGSPRFDVIGEFRNATRRKLDLVRDYNHLQIGIALNQLDNEDCIHQLCIELSNKGYSHIIVRPHPSMPFDTTWYIERGYKCSNSSKENPFEYLSKINVLISGESGIHLDAAMMGVRTICYNTMGEPPLDWYSYIKNGLCAYAENIDVLMKLLSDDTFNMTIVSDKTRWFNAACGTRAEGHVGKMMADFISYERVGDIDGFDKKYGFVEKDVNGVICKVYKE